MASKVKTSHFRCLTAAFALTVAPVISAYADQYAYWSDQSGNFGVMDLATGVATACGKEADVLYGLGMGPGGVLYGGSNDGNLYEVNPLSGAETLIGQTSVSIYNFGSTKSALYAADLSGNLYKISSKNGHAKLIGSMGFGPVALSGMSTGSSALYMTSGSSTTHLYLIDLKTGLATLVGSELDEFDALIFIGTQLYGQDDTTYGFYPINKKTAKIKELTPTNADVLYGLVLIPMGSSTSCGT